MSSAQRLALTRILVCAALIVSSISENAFALTWLPESFRGGLGVMTIFPETFSRNPAIWTLVDIFVPLALLVALLGYRTRLSLAIGLGAYVIESGLIRSHLYFYHTGLAPLQMAVVLLLTPCGDVWSLDARWRKITPKSEATYKWALLLALSPLAMTYLTAGLSKLRSGGLDWFRPDNMRTYIAQSQFHIPPPLIYAGEWLNNVPKIVWSISSALAAFTELGYISILWSRRARWVFPVLAAGMHIFIWVMMGVRFADMIILQAAVFPVERLWSYAIKFLPRASSSYSPSSGSTG